MDINNLPSIIESILFVSGNGLEIGDLTESLGLQKSEVKKALKQLSEKYNEGSGIKLITYNNKIQLATNPAYADSVAAVLNPVKEKELTNAALETVAIIAYRQPITRLEIEQIRGVNCDYAVQVLSKHNLIEEIGRKDAIGKPVLFGTTDAFLKRFQIGTLKELPDYDDLLENIRRLSEASAPKKDDAVPAQSMYNEYEIPDEEIAASVDAAVEASEAEVPDFLKDEKDLVKVD